jgi:hypothetical protein
MWIFLRVWVCGTRAQSLSAPFSYMLYTLLYYLGRWSSTVSSVNTKQIVLSIKSHT